MLIIRIYAQKLPTAPFLCANQTPAYDHNATLVNDVDLPTPELELTPTEVNLRSGRSV